MPAPRPAAELLPANRPDVKPWQHYAAMKVSVDDRTLFCGALPPVIANAIEALSFLFLTLR
ncbi:MAG TPA: hypothetical protein VE263_14175 [Candidatus Angelobacter sp.]|nr:hypothetical protein [Candidatus Angelobacter sp.]